jgi:DNA-binding response OmpR family regulator
MIVRFREPKQMAYRFGPFVYDPVSRGLLHGGVEIALTHKSREPLVLFLHNSGRTRAFPPSR